MGQVLLEGELTDPRLARVVPENSIRYDSQGEGESEHPPTRCLRSSTCLRRLSPDLFKSRRRFTLDLDLVHIPFGGGGPAVAAVVAGHTPISFGSP